MDEFKIVQRLKAESTDIFPKDSRLAFEELCLGEKARHTSYTQNISTDGAGNVSGGGTAFTSYVSHHVGISVRNTSNVLIRVQMTMVKLDQEGYTLATFYVGDDVAPGERRRIWSDLFIRAGSYRITEIAVGAPTSDGRLLQWSAAANPNRLISDLFPLSKNKRSGPWIGIAALLLFGTIAFFGYRYFFIPRADANSAIEISKPELLKLLSGNSIEGTDKNNVLHRIFFEAGGNLRARSVFVGKSSSIESKYTTGKWMVGNGGIVCVEWTDPTWKNDCWAVQHAVGNEIRFVGNDQSSFLARQYRSNFFALDAGRLINDPQEKR